MATHNFPRDTAAMTREEIASLFDKSLKSGGGGGNSGGMDTRITRLEVRFDELGKRIDRFEDNIESRFDKVDSRFDRLEAKLLTKWDIVQVAIYVGLTVIAAAGAGLMAWPRLIALLP